MSLSKESIKRLRAVKAAILAQPKLYNQREYPSIARRHTCNTPCCIAGWAVWIDDPNPKAYNRKLRECGTFGRTEIAEALGVDFDQAGRLFAFWPRRSSPAWDDPETPAGAKDGARRIEHFIKTGGAE